MISIRNQQLFLIVLMNKYIETYVKIASKNKYDETFEKDTPLDSKTVIKFEIRK